MGRGIRIEANIYPCAIGLSFEFLHLLAPDGNMVLTFSVPLKFGTPEVSQNHLPCLMPYNLNCVGVL